VNPQMNPQMGPPRLYRSEDDRVISGVAGGLADYFGIDSAIVRILWVVSVFLTGTLTFWVYLIMIAVVPPEPLDWPTSPWAPGGQPLGFTAGYTPSTSAEAPSSGPGTGAAPADAADPTAAGAPQNASTPPAANMPPYNAQQNGWWGGDWSWQRRQDRWQRRAERWQERQQRWQTRSQDHHEHGGPGLVFGVLLILGGGLLAWHQVDPRIDLGLSWPVLVIALGVILVAASIRRTD
jgi:phage shock protein PspC (stress-responsive transcriptional regulator)